MRNQIKTLLNSVDFSYTIITLLNMDQYRAATHYLHLTETFTTALMAEHFVFASLLSQSFKMKQVVIGVVSNSVGSHITTIMDCTCFILIAAFSSTISITTMVTAAAVVAAASITIMAIAVITIIKAIVSIEKIMLEHYKDLMDLKSSISKMISSFCHKTQS